MGITSSTKLFILEPEHLEENTHKLSAIEPQINTAGSNAVRPKTFFLWLTDIVTLPSPKVTDTSFLASARGDPAVLRPGRVREQAARSVAGHFAQRCPSEITVEDYWEHSEVSFCLRLNTVCLFNVPRWPVFMCAKSVNKVIWQKRKEALLQENINKLKQWMKKDLLNLYQQEAALLQRDHLGDSESACIRVTHTHTSFHTIHTLLHVSHGKWKRALNSGHYS